MFPTLPGEEQGGDGPQENHAEMGVLSKREDGI